jgi:hypothetical protein
LVKFGYLPSAEIDYSTMFVLHLEKELLAHG